MAENKSENSEVEAPTSSENSNHMVKIDFGVIQELGYLSPFEPRSRVAEEFRTIKRPLIKNAFSEDISKGNLIMMTSANSGEGKTFNSLNLALSISMEKDKTVLLIDADAIKASLSEFLGVKEEEGLVDHLLDGGELSDIILPSNVPNLSFIPAGRRYERTTELITSNAMARLVEEVADRYPDRIVLLDAPPLLQTNEASALAEHVGQVVMIVESGKTLRMDVQEAIGKIPVDTHVSFILNKSRRKAAMMHYGY